MHKTALLHEQSPTVWLPTKNYTILICKNYSIIYHDNRLASLLSIDCNILHWWP